MMRLRSLPRLTPLSQGLQTVPVSVPDAGHLPDLGCDQREMSLREAGDVYTDVQRTRRPELRDYTAGYDIEGLEGSQDASERARVSVSVDTQAERLRSGLFQYFL
jgi:hypothetical protein